MGDVWIPNRAVSLEVVQGALSILEEDLLQKRQLPDRLETCLTAAMLVAGYTAALRGEELPQIDVGMMQKYWEEGKTYLRKPHVPLALVGRYKQTNGALKTYIQPLAQITSSGIRLQLWMGRTIQTYHEMGVTVGPMFRVDLGKGRTQHATVSQLDALFHEVLKRLQHHRPDIIPSDVKVEDEYSVRQSLRRGATTKAQNCKIPQQVIETNHRLEKHIRSRGALPSMSMIERYSDVKASVEAVIEFSELM
ncbi:hypothetical protein ACA910_011070 [Epithemia clementina (nom. ined.)]